MPSLKLPIIGQAPGDAAGAEPRRWKSLEELAGARPRKGEFPMGAQEPPAAFGRRGFLQALGASVALAGLEGCKPPREKILPYVRQPLDVKPSIPSAYATARQGRGGHAVGLVVTSREGRPIKVEGNPEHRASLGATGLQDQAWVLDLYDPNRLDGFRRKGRSFGTVSLLAELSALARKHDADGGARLRFLAGPTLSVTLRELRDRILKRFPRARFDTWDPDGAAPREGARIAFGRPLEPAYGVADADVILALDADFLAREGDHLRHQREFARRRTGEKLNRLYVAEAGFTVTGGAADHRFRMRSAEVLPFARAVAAALASAHGKADLAPLGAPAAGGAEAAARAAAVAKDLAAAGSRALVVAGERQPPALHALAAAINGALGAIGSTVSWRESALADPLAGLGSLDALAGEISQGQVDALVVTAWNPVHGAPAHLDLAALLGKVPEAIYLTLRPDATSRAAGWVLAETHPLEAWGDVRSRDGMGSIVQPLIAPLHESISELELLAAFLDEGDRGGYAIVRDAARARYAGPGFERAWDEWLANGFVPGSFARERPAVDLAGVAAAVSAAPAPGEGGVEVNLVADYKVEHGRWIENAWLQELPDPVTKLTWENAVHLSVATARRLGVEDGELVEVSAHGRKVVGPALRVPGHADDAVTLALGWGQAAGGPVGKGTGFDASPLRAPVAPWFAAGSIAKAAGKPVKLAVTQGHFTMEGRDIALAYDAADLAAGHAHGLEKNRGELPSLLPLVDYAKQDYRWGMAIDLSRCVGCGACTIACQAENNIPTVGKAQVLNSREMHWLRVDRYYEGPLEDPRSVTQPLACVHCETAPCEYVCPVNATVHSDEGLNEMVYNRCVGTRYCSNNCPYKVRRFNYLDYRGTYAPTLKMLQNPDVTVRARGVMEKCTYCVQRIESARITARSAGRKIGGDEVVSACQQACPSEAIVFGNLNDPKSKVARLHAEERRYDLLHELGTRPRTGYLVKVRNPNPELASHETHEPARH
jgi:molybdopterin-containing oxidoreductase family iron-sulfur binding subunit